MTVRPDNRLFDEPMVPVTCHTCAGRVEVRKSSWDQTSIQWHADALASCAERRLAESGSGPEGAAFPGCQALKATIREAAVRGEVSVRSEDTEGGDDR